MRIPVINWKFKKYFEQLAPFVKGTRFNTVEFYLPSPEMFSQLRKFLEGTTVNELDFLLDDSVHSTCVN